MEKIIKNPLHEKRKVSMDLGTDFIEQVDAIANLTNTSKGTTIEAIGYHGFPILLNNMKTTWEGLLINGYLDEKKKKKIKHLLEELSKIPKRWEDIIKEK